MIEPIWPTGARPRATPFFADSTRILPDQWRVVRARAPLDAIARAAGVGWCCGGLPPLRATAPGAAPELTPAADAQRELSP